MKNTVPNHTYSIEYSDRYGYSVVLSEDIQDKLAHLYQNDPDKYESLECQLNKINTLGCSEFSFHSDIIELGFVETLDSLEIASGRIIYPKDIIETTYEMIVAIEIYLDENEEYFICPKCGQYIFTELCESEKFGKQTK